MNGSTEDYAAFVCAALTNFDPLRTPATFAYDGLKIYRAPEFVALHGWRLASDTYASLVVYPALLEAEAIPALYEQAQRAAVEYMERLTDSIYAEGEGEDPAEHFASFPVLDGVVCPAATEMALVAYEQGHFDLDLLIVPMPKGETA